MRTVDFNPEDLIILNIRKHIMSLLEEGNFAGVEGVIRGVMYTNRAFCKSMIVWKKKWEKSCSTLLMDVVGKPKVDPPISLIKLILDIAPEAPQIRSAWSPLDLAIYNYGTKRVSSLELIKCLLEADKSKKTLNSIAFGMAEDRGDINVLQYLLSVKEGKTVFFRGSSSFEYSIRHYFRERKEGEKPPSKDYLKFVIETLAEEYKKRDSDRLNEVLGKELEIPIPPKCCCFYDSVNICINNYKEDLYLDEEMPLLMDMIKNDGLYCIKHKRVVDPTKKKRRRLEEE